MVASLVIFIRRAFEVRKFWEAIVVEYWERFVTTDRQAVVAGD